MQRTTALPLEHVPASHSGVDNGVFAGFACLRRQTGFGDLVGGESYG
ncbi:MAG TPA: hypothetical protein VHX38_14260 [Pseudonocardiaceae bacterium]|jgi:hypothetical protein|nr:hypothetical protein [Pseudonocardiaceae bacterium]